MNETKAKLKTKTIVIITIIAIVLGFFSCIDYFHPNLGGDSQSKYVVDGKIIDQEGLQTVFVSSTSNMDNPNFNGIAFCKVEITDSNGNTFKLDESTRERGKYSVWMGKEYLMPGTSYQLKVVLPSGLELISDLDQMPECPDVDSIYYEKKDIPTTDPDKTVQGLQFYIDVDKKNTNSNYYRWELEETWEEHAHYPITWYIDVEKGLTLCDPPDFSHFFCYSSNKPYEFYTLSTEKIHQQKYTRNSLLYVDNQSQRLSFCYSLLVTQYAISEAAFNYWDNLRKSTSKEGGLYNTQPINIKGNIKCTSNSEIEILGFFGAYSVKSKRIFVKNLKNIDLYEPYCPPPKVPTYYDKYQYFIDYGEKPLYGLKPICVLCELNGGTTEKPSFWPSNKK